MTTSSRFMLDSPVLPAEFHADPYPHYRALREAEPVHWSEGLQCWMLTRYDEVAAVLKDWKRFSSVGQVSGLIDRMAPEDRAALCPMHQHFSNNGVINSDPPQHTRLRAAVSRAFLPNVIENLRPGIEQIVQDLLDGLTGRDEFDLISDFAYLLPSTVIARMLGVPIEDRVLFNVWVDEINAFLGSHQLEVSAGLRAQASLMKLRDYYLRLRAERRIEPREDLLSWFNTAQDAGEIADDSEFLVTAVTLLTAGYETTMSLIGNSMVLLLQHPDQLAQLRAAPELAATAIEELLRFESPVQRRVRTVTEDVEMDGHSIRKGQIVLAFPGAANHDPAQFDTPETVDIRRTPNPHLAFGIGRHLCVGAPLARLEGRIALNTILERYPNMCLSETTPHWRHNIMMRGLTSLKVKV